MIYKGKLIIAFPYFFINIVVKCKLLLYNIQKGVILWTIESLILTSLRIGQKKKTKISL